MITSDFYFLGSHNESKKENIIKFAKYAKASKVNFIIKEILSKLETRAFDYGCNNITFTEKTLTYRENLENVKKSKVLVDFVIDVHHGLSLRTFEALGYNKKLITTNKTIKYYDLYNPNNIFILDNNFEEIDDFLAKPYIIDEQIRSKYGFGNWIRYVLDIHLYETIKLPDIE
ncbi:hypothetical protein [Campylobacter suis]|uniref:Uncharacterized protein n=1 Tax=Campylobacter suis TaxID=2790657 RepID=A0ABM8Q0W3_9BACT|nr:hypothetical protein [Campylobacter suis]CAD7286423.1 hypothetical protein LMG8286_00255 [Campylobacter suis]